MRALSRILTLAAAAAMLGVLPAARAETLHAIEGVQADLGDVSVLVYYVPSPSSYHLVATAQTVGDEPTVMRFEAMLLPGQDAVLSVPRPMGQAPVEVVFHRRGDAVEFERTGCAAPACHGS